MKPPAIFAKVEYGTPERSAMLCHSPFRPFNLATTADSGSKAHPELSIYGLSRHPHTDCNPWQYPYMDNPLSAADFLAAALKSLTQDQESKTQEKVAKKSGRAQSTISRISNKTTDPRLSTLDQIARALGKEAWQLLVPNFDAAHPPVLLGSGDPTEAELLRLYRTMPADNRPALLARARTLFNAVESDSKPEPPKPGPPSDVPSTYEHHSTKKSSLSK